MKSIQIWFLKILLRLERTNSLRLSQEVRRLEAIAHDCDRRVKQARTEALQEAAECAYEYLDDPFLSGHGYATGCRNAILSLEGEAQCPSI